jgi:hypothetical protein
MNSEELKLSNCLFPKKTIHITNNYSELEADLIRVLNKNEEVIIAYLERFIFTSSLSETTKTQIKTIFEKINNEYIFK